MPGHTNIYWWFLGVADTNDVIQKIEKTLNNTHTTTQKLTNNSFRNTKKHPIYFSYIGYRTQICQRKKNREDYSLLAPRHNWNQIQKHTLHLYRIKIFKCQTDDSLVYISLMQL